MPPLQRLIGSSPQARGTLQTSPSRSLPRTVHPRRRGEHLFCTPGELTEYGSSPQARGTLGGCDLQFYAPRFIPAGAGNTPVRAPNHPPYMVHPRRRGEHNACAPRIFSPIGSSPQARGTPANNILVQPIDRFIPAGAGNTAPTVRTRQCGAVHPRRRGEHPSDLSKQTREFRFIPAGAGNTLCLLCLVTGATVHPRRRGEHAEEKAFLTGNGGSSPQARGTHVAPQHTRHVKRFIPAGAGNTLASAGRTVHPRRREHHAHHGSSPQARGTLTWIYRIRLFIKPT